MSEPSASAAAPGIDLEVDLLKSEIDALLPTLWKTDHSIVLTGLLKIVSRARSLGPDGQAPAKAFAAQLRERRAFDDLYLLCSELRVAGLADHDIRRWEIQALIELGIYESALDLARPMIATGPGRKEGRDGYSALGRIYKQMYVNGHATRTEEPAILAVYLERAFSAYFHVWQHEKSTATAYYGVNAVALAYRAIADKVSTDIEGARALAEDVLVFAQNPADAWSFATRGELLVALGRYEEAASAYTAFAANPTVREVVGSGGESFHLAAALRQLEEVWRLDPEEPESGKPVRALKISMLAQQHLARLDEAGPGKLAGLPSSIEITVSPREAVMLREDTRETAAEAGRRSEPSAADSKGYERIFGANAPLPIQLIRRGLERASAICRIDVLVGGVPRPLGTGFAIIGRLLHESWGDEPVIVTNNHVVSSGASEVNQHFANCSAVFVADDGAPSMIEFDSILWESDPEAHDITVLRPRSALPPQVQPLSAIARAPLPARRDGDEEIGRIFVIGHPLGGPLSFVYADNMLIDHDAFGRVNDSAETTREYTPTSGPVRLHYKAPTLGGNSGSPLFDFNQYNLIGVHRRGLPTMERLAGKKGTYAANEGVWIESIRMAIAETFTSAESASHDGVAGRWRALNVKRANSAPVTATAPKAAAAPAPRAGHTSRLAPGSFGEPSSGLSPVATQLIRTGKAKAAEISALSNESIIGLDGRTRIIDTPLSPWRMICAIRCRWGTRLAVGTGFLVSPNLVLTAGHVVFPRDRRTLPSEIEVIPGLNGEHRPHPPAPVAAISVHPSWETRFELPCDIAAIHLSEPVGHTVGWFGIASRGDQDLRHAWAHVTGYPGEKLDQPIDRESGRPAAPIAASQLWHHAAPILQVSNNRVFYAIDTTAGQSGAPIYIHEPAASVTPIVVGVHAYGAASTPSAVGEANSGAWIDEAMFELILQWREQAAAILRGDA